MPSTRDEVIDQIRDVLREFGRYATVADRRDIVGQLVLYVEEEERRKYLHDRFDRLSTEEMEKMLGPEPEPEPELSGEQFLEKFPEFKNSGQ